MQTTDALRLLISHPLAPAILTSILLGPVAAICWRFPSPVARVTRWFVLSTVVSTVVGLAITGLAST